MKRIIEIDDEVVMNCALYSDCQLGEDLAEYVNITELASTIAQSKPYDDSGDLISRSELIKKLEEMANNEWNIQVGSSKGLEDAIDVIDNAQAIPLPSEQIAWEQGYEAGLAQGKNDRPKGEWLYTDKEDRSKGYGGYCSNCKCDMPIGIEDWKQKYYESNFCPNCGADMRGDKT